MKVSGETEDKCLHFGFRYISPTTKAQTEKFCFVCTYENGYVPNYIAEPAKRLSSTK